MDNYKLSPREQNILELRFLKMMTLKEVSNELDVTCARIKHIESVALRKLITHLKDNICLIPNP